MSATGSGKDGRITKGDVLAFLNRPAPAPPPAPAAKPPRTEEPREQRVRMTRLRRTIAARLKEAQNTAAMLTTFNEVDMSAVMALRSEYREAFEKKHPASRLGFMSFFVRACCVALKEFPAVNAEIDGDDIVYKNFVHMGIAVGGPTGLVVPVVRDADAMSFADIERAIADFGKRVREGALKLEELTGGTFSITNGGIYGSLMSTPILNPPQSAILGMHKIQERPVAIAGKVEIRPMMYLALSLRPPHHRRIGGGIVPGAGEGGDRGSAPAACWMCDQRSDPTWAEGCIPHCPTPGPSINNRFHWGAGGRITPDQAAGLSTPVRCGPQPLVWRVAMDTADLQWTRATPIWMRSRLGCAPPRQAPGSPSSRGEIIPVDRVSSRRRPATSNSPERSRRTRISSRMHARRSVGCAHVAGAD